MSVVFIYRINVEPLHNILYVEYVQSLTLVPGH